MHKYNLDHVCSYNALLNPEFEVIGPTPEGLRVNVYVTGGKVTGPLLTGEVLPVGADWLTIRPDGVGCLNVRTTIKTHDGALIYLTYTGIAELGHDGYQNFLDGKPALTFPIQAAMRMITAHPDYLWVNRLQMLNIGAADLNRPEVSYDVYAIR